MKKLFSIFVGLSLLLISGIALADEVAQPDFTVSVLSLLEAVKGKASIVVILVAVFQLLKTAPVVGILGKVSGKYMQVIIAVTTVGGFIVDSMARGTSLVTAAVEGLFTSGGAMLLYSAIKSIKS